jgi:hypothetical protein
VDSAKPGARLVVKGVCTGATVIDRDLAIQGVRTDGEPAVLLGRGGAKVRILRVVADATVTVKSLYIRGGYHGRGAGLQNHGTVTLRDVVVIGNFAPYPRFGPAIWNGGTLSLRGDTTVTKSGLGSPALYNVGMLFMEDRSSIHDNVTGSLINDGTATMNGASSILDNSAGVGNGGSLTMNGSSSIVSNGTYAPYGGGVSNAGTLTMNDASRISENIVIRCVRGTLCGPSVAGGGVYNRGTLSMNGTSAISGNLLAGGGPDGTFAQGGGIYNASGGTLTGVVCGPGGNVSGNTPDDCYIEP